MVFLSIILALFLIRKIGNSNTEKYVCLSVSLQCLSLLHLKRFSEVVILPDVHFFKPPFEKVC